MKRFLQVGITTIMVLFVVSCVSMADKPSSAASPKNGIGNIKLLNPNDVVGKKLAGTDETGSYSFLLNPDGTLQYTVNDNVYNGTWTFDDKSPMYRYAFDWTEGEKNKDI